MNLKIVFSKVWGTVSDSELLQRQHNMGSDPDFCADFSHFFDLSEAKLTDITTPVIHKLAEHSPFGVGSKQAILAPRDLEYGLSRIYATTKAADDGQVRVFRSREEANRWLGLEDENGHYRLA